MFAYTFMQRALIAIVLLATILPMIGLNMTTKRLSMIGDTLAHTSLCGIAIGLAAGTFPTIWAIVVSIIAGVTIEIVRNYFSKYSELILSVVMSAAVGIVGILTSKWASGNSIESYLFGSLLNVDWTSIWMIVGIFVVTLLFNIAFYKMIMYSSYSESEAMIAGVPVKLLNMINTILIAATIAVSSSIIGSLLVSSLLIIPVASSLQLFKSYKMTIISSIVISLASGVSGLCLSYVWDVNTGGTIVLITVVILIAALIYKSISKTVLKKRTVKSNI